MARPTEQEAIDAVKLRTKDLQILCPICQFASWTFDRQDSSQTTVTFYCEQCGFQRVHRIDRLVRP